MNQNIKSVAYGNGVFIAAAGDRILRSTDGENWTLARMTNTAVTAGNQLTRVIFGDGKFLVCGEFYFYITSDNGITWTEFSSPSGMAYAAYGDGKFYLSCTGGSGIAQVDLSTMQFSWLSYTTMGEIAYLNHTLYTVKQDSTDANLYRLNSSNVWEGVVSGIPTGSNRTLRSVGNRLFMGMGTYTFEFQKGVDDVDFTSFKWISMVYGKMIDGCERNDKAYILTADTLYEETTSVATADGSVYVCCCANGDDIIHVFDSAGNTFTYPEPPTIQSMAYGNGVYIGVTLDKIVKSTDGVTWDVVKNLSSVSSGNVKNKVVFGDGKFLVCTANYYFVTSDNGTTWTEKVYPSPLYDAAYGNGYFLLSSNEAGGTIKLNPDTLERTIIASAMGEITYLDGTLYGVKTTASDPHIYYLNSSNVWTILSGNYTIPSSEERCLKGINNRLFLGIGNATYEVAMAPETNYAQLSLLDISGRMIDACTINGRFYLLTESGLYEDGSLVEAPSEGNFTCCCAGKDNQIRTVAVNGTKAVYTGYTSVAPTFTIKSMAFGNGVYIAVAEDRILRSADGVNWETVQMTNHFNSSHSLYRVVFAEGKFVVGGDCVIYTSMDNGSSWWTFSSSVAMDSVAYGDGKFMLTSSQYPCVIRLTADALQKTWIDTDLKIQDIVYVNDAFYGIYYKSATENGLYKLNSSNAWTLVLGNLPIGPKNCLRTGDNRLFLGSNGITYQFRKTGTEFSSIDEMAAITTQMIDACEFPDIESLEPRVCIISDTMMHTTMNIETSTPPSYANSEYLCCCANDYGQVLLSQGSTIKKYTQDADPCDYHIQSICYGNNVCIAAAGDYILRLENSATGWEVVQKTPTVDGNQLTRAVFGNNVFVVCGGHYYYISTDNGTTWTQGEYYGFLTGAAFGDGRFILVGGGTVGIDVTGSEITYFNCLGSGLRDVAFAGGKFYSIDDDSVFCSLSSGNIWTKWFPIYEAKDGYCLRGCGDRLFVGADGQTYEFQKNENNTAFESYKPVLGVSGQLLDGCQMDGKDYLLTEKALHQFNKAVFAPISGNCTCCCTANDNVNIAVFTHDSLGNSRSMYHKGDTLKDYGIKDVLQQDDLYIAAAGTRILKSDDGLKWRVVYRALNSNYIRKTVFGDGVLIAYGVGHYYKSTDGGETWTPSDNVWSITGAAYGENTFVLIDTTYTIRIDAETLAETLIEMPGMYDVAYAGSTFYGVRNTKLYDDTTFSLYRINGDVWIETDCAYSVPEGPCCLKAAGSRLFFGKDDSTYEFKRNAGSNSFNWLYPYTDVYGKFIDACVLEEQEEEVRTFTRALSVSEDPNTYVATSTGLYYLGNETVLLESLEDLEVSGLSADKNGLNLTLGSGSGSYQADYHSSNLPDFDSGSNPDFTKDTAKYSVITDTHGTPFGRRRAYFDLGDNTKSYGETSNFTYYEPVEDTHAGSATKMTILGNHDVAQYLHEGSISQNILMEKRKLQIYPDKNYKIVFYGFSCCNTFGDFEIKPADIREMVNDMLSVEHRGWNVAVLTHVPLFAPGASSDSAYNMKWAWTENKDKAQTEPKNSKVLLDVLRAYQKHTTCTCYEDNSGPLIGSWDFSYNATGYVIGCFCGHIHRGLKMGRNYSYKKGDTQETVGPYGIFMQAFAANGERSYMSRTNWQGDGNDGWYEPSEQSIYIDFANKTVNGFSYDPENKDPKNEKLEMDAADNIPKSIYADTNRAVGVLPFMAGHSYPKFYVAQKDDPHPELQGTYVGYSSSSKNGIPDYTYGIGKASTDSWEMDCSEISYEYGNIHQTYSDSFIRFGVNGRLRFHRHTKEGPESEFPNYKEANISFVANDIRWNFKGGIYQWDKAKGYGFRKPESSGNSYPIFDTDGRYIGWSDKPNGYMVGGRNANDSSSLTWSLGKGKATLTVGGALQGQAESVTFNENGTLKQFKLTTGSTVTTVTGSVEFVTDGNVTWTFSGGLFYNVKGPNATPIPMKLYDWMDFTSQAYYFNFEDGYLTFYATSKNGTKLYNIEGPWNCGKNVAYYSSASAMAQGQAAEATVNTAELNFAKDSAGNRFYISNLDTKYKFAMIQTNYGKYYFQNENGKWLMIHF